jgi:hypothetical protein
MTFKKATDVLDVLRSSDDVERQRGYNRTKVNQLANGAPLLSEEEAEKMGVKVNSNFLEGPILFANAKRQYTNNFLSANHFFKVQFSPWVDVPKDHKLEWEMFFTEYINHVMKENRLYFHVRQNQFQALVTHGIAPTMWWDRECWLQKYVAIEDLRVATDTEISFENLEWFGIRVSETEGSLNEKVFGKYADRYWDKKAIAAILHHYRNMNYTDLGANFTWEDQPEKVAELIKQNGGRYASDAVPTIPLWNFYFRDRDDKGNSPWMLRVVPDWNVGTDGTIPTDQFLYNCPDPAADELSQTLHVQFGDLSFKAPALYHSIRSLGFLLMEPCFWSNLTQCRVIQHLMEMMNTLLRVVDPAGRARAEKIDLYDKAIVPEGVSIVPSAERHQVDNNLVELVMAQMKQRMAEASASYTQQSDTGTQKEQTAYETHVKVSMVNALMQGLILVGSFQEKFAFREICRRFCLRKTSDKDAQRFQEECKRRKIPKRFINSELWMIEPELPMGAGNPALAVASAQQLLQMRPMFGPQAQQEILYESTAIISGDARKAKRWVPLDEAKGATPAQKYAESDFSILMRGLPVNQVEGVNPIEQIETLMGLMAGELTVISQGGNMTDMRTIKGLVEVGKHIEGLIQQLSADEQERERANNFSKSIGKLTNEVRGLHDRLLQEQQKAQQNGHDPEAEAKIMTLIQTSQAKLKAKQMADAQKMTQKQISFEAEQKRKNVQLATDVQRKGATTAAEIASEQAKTVAEIANADARTDSEIKNADKKAEAEPAQKG